MFYKNKYCIALVSNDELEQIERLYDNVNDMARDLKRSTNSVGSQLKHIENGKNNGFVINHKLLKVELIPMVD